MHHNSSSIAELRATPQEAQLHVVRLPPQGAQSTHFLLAQKKVFLACKNVKGAVKNIKLSAVKTIIRKQILAPKLAKI